MYFLLATIFSLLFTFAVGKIARYFNIVDKPIGGRHVHQKEIPLLGGAGIFLSFWLITITWFFLDQPDFSLRQLGFLFLGSLLVMMVGFFDDKYKTSAKKRLFLTALAVLIVMLGGMNFDGITNPFGGTFGLDFWQIGTPWGIILVAADLLVFFWILGMVYSTKVLDGLDGLSAGIVLIGCLMIAALASMAKFFDPDIKTMSLVFAGSILGFWFLNFYPAKIFLGEGGSMFLGLVLGFLAVVSGGKIATALLVMAIPVLDLGRVIFKRYKNKKRIFEGDREHLHFKLLDLGLNQRQAVLILYGIALLFGLSTLVLPSFYKMLVLGFLVLFMILFEIKVSRIKVF